MRGAALGISLVTFVIVAALTVELHVRASLRSYQLGRERDVCERLARRTCLLRDRIEERYTPVGVYWTVTDLRRIRAGAEQALEI